jgi:hypothetical protein
MKFLMTFTADPNAAPPTPEQLAAIGEYSYRMIQSGVVVLTGGVVRPSHGTKVRLEAGKFSVTDGPFAETKELIDGFAIIKAASREEAIQHCSDFMKVAGEGQGEILRIFDEEDLPPGPVCEMPDAAKK